MLCKGGSRETYKHKEAVKRPVARRRVSLTGDEDAQRSGGRGLLCTIPGWKGSGCAVSFRPTECVFSLSQEKRSHGSAGRARGRKESDQLCTLRFLFCHVGNTLQLGSNETWEAC